MCASSGATSSCAAPSRAAAARRRCRRHRPLPSRRPRSLDRAGHLRFARAPIWGDGALSPRPAMVRVYAIADGGRPLARAARRHDAGVPARRRQRQHAARRHQPGHLGADRRPGGQLLDAAAAPAGGRHRAAPPARVSSRMGENLFWLGRYTERTEQLVRLARATLLVIDADSDAAPPVLQALSALAVRAGLAPAGRAHADAIGAPVRARRAGRPGRRRGRAGVGQRGLQPGGAGACLAWRCASACRPNTGA
jgi:hypothetical protein